MKTARVTYNTNLTPPPLPYAFRKEKMSSTPVKNEKIFIKINVHKMGGAHLQCMNNH